MKFWTFVAKAMIIIGSLRLVMGFVVASLEGHEGAARRYLGSASSGEAIDQGLTVLAVGLFARFVLKRLNSES